ncbi:hypothetical protein Nocox_09455 [Nonomuraea coxensis DSM 45129]|uniref:Secreted protein n=1 Tax=Nonomuraea coxensis DSM 45129 TaxID=1122611 RepID=A0ABX8TXP4_9ACTN|nr:hypothetical protein [Nonomuraea coxensis]QYC39511.1 hypothetical protein Nocox_09455 [Nonomuraea coxensis DSM 45129]
MRVTRTAAAGLLGVLTLSGPVPASAARLYDFAVPDVVLWSEPTASSLQNGLGQPGEGFALYRSEEHELHRCGWFESTLWHHGRNLATGVTGWVPACDTDDPD